MVDEAHATGLYGASGAGLIEHLGITSGVEILMGTLGKALGAAGGFVCGSRILIDYLVNRARSFILSTAPPPAASAAARMAVSVVRSCAGAELRQLLWKRAGEMAAGIKEAQAEPLSAILPVIIGKEEAAMAAARALYDRGVFVPGIR